AAPGRRGRRRRAESASLSFVASLADNAHDPGDGLARDARPIAGRARPGDGEARPGSHPGDGTRCGQAARRNLNGADHFLDSISTAGSGGRGLTMSSAKIPSIMILASNGPSFFIVTQTIWSNSPSPV